MKRAMLMLTVVLLLAAQAAAQDQNKTAATDASRKEKQQKLQENPNDAEALQAYLNERLSSIYAQSQKAPDAAEKQLQELQEFLRSLEVTEEEAKELLERAQRSTDYLKTQIKLARQSFEDLQKQVQENPNQENVQLFVSKGMQEVMAKTRTEPAAAAEMLDTIRQTLAKVRESDDEALQEVADSTERVLAGLERRVEASRKLAELVGKEAIPIEAEAWVNGEPLSDEDLKGKVVLLDFWAVWCGPCIATFPHLREWHESYADQGLEIIGLTKYYNFKWNEEQGRAERATEVSKEEEQEMLKKFAAEHDLKHRFALQGDDELSDYYAVTGIPHVVLIDRQGKIRLIRVGSGEQNAKDIEEMIQKLL